MFQQTAAANTRAKCSICNKANTTYVCSGCSKGFCFQHLTEHRQILGNKLEEIVSDHDQFQQTIIQKKQNPLNSSFIEQINQWETDSIDQIQQTAKECREILMTLTQKSINDIENKLIELSQKLKETREENEFNDFDLNNFQLQLTQITEELNVPSNISIRKDSQEFIKKISVISSPFEQDPQTHPHPHPHPPFRSTETSAANTNSTFSLGSINGPAFGNSFKFGFSGSGGQTTANTNSTFSIGSTNGSIFGSSVKSGYSGFGQQTSTNANCRQ